MLIVKCEKASPHIHKPFTNDSVFLDSTHRNWGWYFSSYFLRIVNPNVSRNVTFSPQNLFQHFPQKARDIHSNNSL